MRTLKLSALAVLTAMFFACGDDVTKVSQVTNEISGLEIVSSVDSLGKCTEEISGEMKFAQKENAIFVCADSVWQNVSVAGKDGEKGGTGKDGSDGKDGTSCAVELLADSSGYKVVCDGDSVGLVLNGSDGKDGEKGADGNGCTLSDNGDGTLLQICGADSVTLYKARCGTRAYNPDSNFCYGDSIVSLCDGKSYDISREFCDFRDGRVYKFTVIGSQTWMAENAGFDEDLYSICLNDIDSCAKFGRLYSAQVAEEACPEGWHLPTAAEWDILIDYADKRNGDDSVGTSLKSQTGWENGGNGLDEFGFNALPAGRDAESWISIIKDGFPLSILTKVVTNIGILTCFWTASIDDLLGGYIFIEFSAGSSSLSKSTAHNNFNDRFSVRCVKD